MVSLCPAGAKVEVLPFFGLMKLIWKSRTSLGTTLTPLSGRLITLQYGESLASTATWKLTKCTNLGAFSPFYIVSTNSLGYAWEILMRFFQCIKKLGVLFGHSNKWMALRIL